MQFRHAVCRVKSVDARHTAAIGRAGLQVVLASAMLVAPWVGARAAHADETVTYSINVDSAQIQQMLAKAPPQQRQAMEARGMGGPTHSTISVHGGVMRQDDGTSSRIVDVEGHKITMFDRAQKKYLTDAFSLKPFAAQSHAPVASVEASGPKSRILGHTVSHYTFSLKQVNGPGSMSGEIWAAADLRPLPFDPLTNNPASPLSGKMKIVKGLPLKVVVHMAGAQGTTTITQTATAVSLSPLSNSQFAVPAGFTKVEVPKNPGGSMPPPPAQPAHP